MAGKVPSTILFFLPDWGSNKRQSKFSASFSWDVVLKDAQHSGIYTLTIEKLTHKMDTIYISARFSIKEARDIHVNHFISLCQRCIIGSKQFVLPDNK